MIDQKVECARHWIEAKPEAVFRAWTTPELVERWWGPEGFTTRVLKLDLAIGGSFAFEMTAPSGAQCVMSGVYRRIEPSTLLVFEIHEHCNIEMPAGIRPQETTSVVTVEFQPTGMHTLVIVSQEALNDSYRDLAALSWASTLKKLTARALGFGAVSETLK